eukprot:1171066-Pleurochrysis_carterae.AAC.1
MQRLRRRCGWCQTQRARAAGGQGWAPASKPVSTHSFSLSTTFERALPPATVDRVVASPARTQRRYSAR